MKVRMFLFAAAASLALTTAATAQTYSIERVFARVTLPASPVFITEASPTDPRLFVVGQGGIIRALPRKADPLPSESITFLDINTRVLFRGEQGLLGLAFDPDFATTGDFYVYYTFGTNDSSSTPGVSRISRFRMPDPTASSANNATETILLEVAQPFTNHNGGMIAFGPDNNLYIGLGDGGSSNDPQGNGQSLTTLLGKILRIDVLGPPDNGLAYAIPPDNPFFSHPTARKEIYAYGIRNPYRFSFDQQTDRLLLGDVGQDTQEEIDDVVAGGNYGWKVREGAICRPGQSPCTVAGVTFEEPIAILLQSEGAISITGGYTYYGTRNPSLVGTYIFGDYGTGTIWGIEYDGTPGLRTPIPLYNSAQRLGASNILRISSFGQTSDGEIYIIDYFTSRIYQLVTTTTGWNVR